MYCPECGHQLDQTSRFCGRCGKALATSTGQATQTPVQGPAFQFAPAGTMTMATAADAAVLTDGKRYAIGKTAWVAILLSLIFVGCGQFYNGDYKKGAVILIVGFVVAVMTVGIGYWFIVAWAMIDGYKVAHRQWALW